MCALFLTDEMRPQRTHCTRHTGVRRFECEHCNARFFTKGDYERHARLHSGAPGQFSCTYKECAGKVFSRSQALRDHMNKHYGREEHSKLQSLVNLVNLHQ